jgi:predicted ferric reductase
MNNVDYEQEQARLALAYTQHALPVCVYGGDEKLIENWVQKITEKSDQKTMVIRDAEKRSHAEQAELAKSVQKKDQKTRMVFITSRSPYELEKNGVMCRELAVELSVLPVELAMRSKERNQGPHCSQ